MLKVEVKIDKLDEKHNLFFKFKIKISKLKYQN